MGEEKASGKKNGGKSGSDSPANGSSPASADQPEPAHPAASGEQPKGSGATEAPSLPAPAPLPVTPPAAQLPAVREPRPQRFLFVSKYGLIHDLAWEVKKEGHDVRYHIMQKSERDVGDGFVEKIERWEDCKEWADLIVFDDCEFGTLADRLRAEGKRVVGGTPYTDRLEMDRDFGQEEMRSAGLTTLPRWEFGSFDAAIAFIKASPGRYVIKPSGRAQNEKVLSFVGQEEDGLDVLTMLEHYRNGWGSKIKSFQLQKYASGVEVAVGAFFNGTDFVQPAFINFEHKRMFNDDIGPQTGEMGTSGFWMGSSTLFQQTLFRMKDRLAAARYCGYVDINCIANSRGIYPLEFTCRFGYPTINLQMEGMLSRWSELLTGMGRGQPVTLRTKKGFQICVVIAVPPFPFVDAETFRKFSEDAAVIFRKPVNGGVHPCDIRLVDGDWRLAGSSGYALVVTGSGSTMDDARREAYNRVKNIVIPNMFYRTDIGERWHRDGDLLQTWGYLL
ncbi:MAG TPA: phosphoribosylglycinamide synthetase C domain-containing protein [Spirochaetia bacterium]|nr:phosphoribosylglycinamide synthetase C domain-containing protein [Spirochaetia bacterium]